MNSVRNPYDCVAQVSMKMLANCAQEFVGISRSTTRRIGPMRTRAVFCSRIPSVMAIAMAIMEAEIEYSSQRLPRA